MLKPWRAEPDHTALFHQRYDGLVAQARRVLKLPREQATELVHEAFLQFIVNQPDLDAIENLDGYLFGMLRKLHVSSLRRASRQRTLSMAEYDSATVALRDAAGAGTLQALQELAQVCAYCATRRHTSKAGSVLALRYFYGRTPAALVVLMGATAPAVKQWLHLARREAGEYLTNPDCAADLGPAIVAPRIALAVPPEERLGAFVAWLRQRPSGDCLKRDQIDALSTPPAALDRPTLAHIVSCAECLLLVDHIRAGKNRVDPPAGGPLERFGARKAVARQDSVAVHRSRLVELREHRPATLCVHVNGFFIGSHRLTSGVTEFMTRMRLDEPIEFVEVLSEQAVRLALVEATSLGHPASTTVRLDDERSLEVSIDISEPWPSVAVRYVDPHFEALPSDLAPSGHEDVPAIARQESRDEIAVERPSSFASWHLWTWPWRTLAWRLALVLLAGWLATSPSQAAELATRAWQYAAAVVRMVLGTTEIAVRPTRLERFVAFAPAISPARPQREAIATVDPPSPVDLDALEIGVLRRLDGVGGLLGDEVTVNRVDVPGRPRILVRAIVASAARKLELVETLGLLARTPEVSMEIVTTDEALAVAAPRRQSAAVPQLRVEQLSEPRVPAYDAIRDAMLRSTPSALPGEIDLEVRRVSMDALNRSLRARLHAHTAVSLVERFAGRSAIASDVRQQLDDLIARHAITAGQETRGLRLVLERAFSWSDPSGGESDAADSDRDRAVIAQRLAAIAAQHDALIGKAFAVSTTPTRDLTATLGAFDASLRQAERLAHRLATLLGHATGS